MNLADYVGSLGFPIALACWLLYREEKTLKPLITAINKLTDRLKIGE